MSELKPGFFKKSLAPLFLILLLIGAGAAVVLKVAEKGVVETVINKNGALSLLFIFETDQKPASNQLLLWYPARGKAALMDIPSSMGIILKSANRMNSIDSIYDHRNPSRYVKEIGEYLKYPIDGWFVFNEKALVSTIDLLEGVQIFVPEPVVYQEGNSAVSLPGGSVRLDGDKALQYLRHAALAESYGEEISRRQSLAVSIFAQLSRKSEFAKDPEGAALLASKPASNYNLSTKKEIFKHLSRIDADTIIMQFISGSFRQFEGRKILFPYYDGELARDVIRQTAKALGTEDTAVVQKAAVTVEILNGSGEKGIATVASMLFESYGYKVVSLGNAPTFNYARTIMYDNEGDKNALQQAAEVIGCRNFGDPSELSGTRKADITIVLGKDFNGRYCVGQ